MNAQYGFPRPALTTDITRDNIRDMAILVALSKQPQVNPELDLLRSSYEHDGLSLDLYGSFYKDDDCYDVQDATLAGTSVSLQKLLSADQLKDMSAWCDRHLSSAAEQEQERRDEAFSARRAASMDLAA